MFLLSVAPDLFCAVTANYSEAEAEFLPAALAGLTAVGQFYGQANLNPEEIARINPEVIIDIGEPKKTIAEDMDGIAAATGVPAIHVTADLRSAPEAFRTLGRLLGREEKGEALAAYCEKVLSRADGIMAKVGANKKTALYCLGKQGTNVLAKGSFHAEVLDWLAGNAAVVDNPSSRGSGNETDLEQLLLWNPDVILFGYGSVYGQAPADPVWKQLKAIRGGDFYEVPQGPYNWMGSPPSINRYLGILWLGKILYPQYADYDLYGETAEYYRLFYDYDLSRARYASLTANSVK
jgi:iron complex transport system substrate-binding protein